MPIRNIRNLLGASSELAALRVKTQRLMALQRAYVACVDCTPVGFAELIKASRVGYLQAGTLYILADNAAVAAKLRQLLPRLLPLFQKLETEVTGIRVDVQPKNPWVSPPPNPRKGELPVDYIEKFNDIAKTIVNPELKSAVTKLVRNRAKKP